LQRELEEVEGRVAALERDIATASAALEAPTLYDTPAGVARAHELAAEISRLRVALDAAVNAWAKASDALAREAQVSS
jgi:hypothetical protein